MNAFQRLSILGLLPFAVGVLADEGFPWYPEDPLGTHVDVSDTPGRAPTQVDRDPCLPKSLKRERWSLVDVIDQSLCHNPQTHQAWANAKQTASQLGSAESAYLPSVNMNMPISRSANTAGGGISTGIPVNGGGGTKKSAEYTRITPNLTVSYLLFDFGGRAARVEAARQALEAANWQHAATIQNVLFGAMQAYYQLFAAKASLEAAEQTVKSMQVAFDSAAYRFQVGSAALGDKLQAQTTLAQAKVNLRTAEGNAKAALGGMANAMGLNPHAQMEFEAPNLMAPDPETEKDIETLMDIARESRPDLAAAEAQVKSSQAGVLSARSQGMPQLALSGSYSYLDTINNSAISSWAIGVQVSVPLFTGFNNSYQVRQAQEQVEMQSATRDQLEQAITQAVWQAYYTLGAYKDNLHNTEVLLDSAKEAERVALGRYREGVGNIVEVTNAENNLANARYSYVNAHYSWRIGKAQLAQALGRLDAGDVEAVEGSRQNGVIE
jgi:TolC family type I secretion outer membrane protein